MSIDLSDEHGQALLTAIGDEREPVLYRWSPPPQDERNLSDVPLEYAVVTLADPSFAGDGVMLYGRYRHGWKANPGERALVAHLLAIAKTLPRTADGAPIVPGMTVWINAEDDGPPSKATVVTIYVGERLSIEFGPGDGMYVRPTVLYASSDAAALAPR
jgi:hypothetical protein